MAPRFTRIGFFVSLAVVLALAMNTTSSGQNIASAKAFFAAGTDNEVYVPGDTGARKILEGDLKTSTVGDLMVGVSLECALWTGTANTATKGGGKTTSKSRAAVNVTVYVDSVPAEPGQVVYCDREQEVNLTFDSTDDILNDSITLEIFLRTKNANHFNFYIKNPGSGVHHVEVWASSLLDDTTAAAGATRAAIGKRTMVVEEFNSAN
jgi:hypothetical protein